jgi:flagellar motility protein MotE (MotC chaperone)
MRRFIPYFVIFLGIVTLSKVMTLLKTDTTLVNVMETNAGEDSKKIDNGKEEIKPVKDKIRVMNQNGDILFNLYNIDTSQIKKIETCNELYDLKFSPEEVQLLQTLRSRRDKLNEIEKDLQTKSDILKSIEVAIDSKLQQLEKINSQMTDDNNLSPTMSYNKLVKIYEGMKPKEAAKIFDTLQTQVLLGVANQMKENKLAAIVAEMNPEKARDLTMGLANKRG